MLTHGSLFDGFGGLRRGFEDAGFETKWARDLIYGNDITKDDPADLEWVDLISGGPPCQRGSELAKFDQSRTFVTLWPEMLRFVEVLLPDWVVLENVPGFQRQMVDWTADLHQLGYGCAGQLIDSRHWVPQQRTRCFVIGRMGTEGMALWNHLYAPSQREPRMQGRTHSAEANGESRNRSDTQEGYIFPGPCDDCMPRGILTRSKAMELACMGAGNAVTQPLAQWIAERIKAALEEKE